MAQISFYILSPHKNLIAFVCQLIQTVLNKSDETIIVMTPPTYLRTLDDALWSFKDVSFIPHQIVQDADIFKNHVIKASVVLTDNVELLKNFDGIVVNLTDESLVDFTGSRLLEIIDAAPKNVESGRRKYRHYQQWLAQTISQSPEPASIQVYQL